MTFAITGKCLVKHKTYIDPNVFQHSPCTSEGSLPQPWEHKLKLVDPTLEDVEHSQDINFELGDVHSVHHYVHVESLVSPFTLM